MFRPVLLTLSVALLLLPGTVVSGGSLSDPFSLKQSLVTWATDRLGRKLSIGQVSATWNGTLVLGDVRLSDAAGKTDQLTATRIETDYAVSSLLTGSQDILRVRYFEPRLKVSRRADGTTDIDDILAQWSRSTVGPSGPLPPSSITSGSVQFDDAATGRPCQLGSVAVQTTTTSTGDVSIAGTADLEQVHTTVSATWRPARRRLDLHVLGATWRGTTLHAADAVLDWLPTGPVFSAPHIHVTGANEQLKKGSVLLPGGRPITIKDAGNISLENRTLEIKGLPVQVGSFGFVLAATATVGPAALVVQRATAAWSHSHLTATGPFSTAASDLSKVAVEGQVDLRDLPGGGGVSGVATYKGRLKGDPRNPTLVGTATCSDLRFRTGSGNQIPISGASAGFTATAADLELTRLNGGVAGGRVSGTASWPAGQKVRFDLKLAGAPIASLMRLMGASSEHASGTIDVAFKGRGMGRDISGAGHARIPALTIDVSQSAAVASGRKSLRGGRVAGGALAIALGANPLGFLMLAGATHSNFYSRMLDELSRPHQLRSVNAALKLERSTLVVDPIEGPDLSGSLRVGLASDSLSGRFAMIRLGAVEIRDVPVSGTLSSPNTQVDPASITMNGQTAPSQSAAGGVKEGIESVPRGIGGAIHGIFGGLFH